MHRELEHELAVLALADLQERALVGDADVVALGVDEQEVGALAGDLAAEDERRRRRVAERRPVPLVDLAAEPPDVDRRLVQVRHGRQALVVAGRGEVGVDAVEHLVGGGQRACRLQHEQPVVAGPQHVQLAVGADVVDAGVGAGVGEEDQALVEAEGHAVGHRRCLGCSDRGGW